MKKSMPMIAKLDIMGNRLPLKMTETVLLLQSELVRIDG